MESVNPLNILNLLLPDYEQHFQLSDSPSESDKTGRRVPKIVRKFLPVLFTALQEPKRIFVSLVKKSMFKASNLCVTASTSGKMIKELYIEGCEKIFFAHMNQHCLFLADSWSTFSDQAALDEVKPEELEYE
ncbi:hypothetical protein RvY_15945 [Ramazzottius varieornatus]|uniref:DDE-1 domain-containing protein n=1 Tax=Ramazzottius varieornatus TaxID=947166 RepID=A0A1D1VWP7_RAMVA|nr:hypothetical protein RvY_15945 [Ramazzottius varieornatus]